MSETSLADVIRPLDWVTSAPSPDPPGENQVRLWSLARSQIPLHDTWLAPDELSRAARMQQERRDEFVSGRNALRLILGWLLGRRPAEVALRLSEKGKPCLEDASIEFSFSHCDGQLLLGVASRPLGIDLERRKARANLMRIAQRSLDSNCCEQLLSSAGAEREQLFYRFWSAHEAVQKLRGDGLFGERHLPACVGSFTLAGFDAAVACSIAEPELGMHETLPHL